MQNLILLSAVSIWLYKYNILLNFVLDHNYRVYVLDQQQWSIMGRYSVVVEDDEEAIWEEDEGGKVTHILLVSFIGHYFKILIEALFRKMIVIILWPLRFHHHSITVLLL